MALTVSFSPDVASWIQGDSPITLSLTGTHTAGYDGYYWESDSGTFSNKFAANPVFTPNNATKIVSVIGRRVFQGLTGPSAAVFTTVGSNGTRKSSGSSSSWDSMNTGSGLGGSDGFFEWEITETSTEKVAGLMDNSIYVDPLLTGTNSFLHAWHFSANGTAVVRKQGIPLIDPIFYKAGDSFKVEAIGTKVFYYYNKTKVAETTRVAGNLYGVAGFKTIGSVIDGPRFFIFPSTNQGVKTLVVHGIFPEQPNYSYELNQDNTTLVSFAEDKSARYKVKGGLKKNLNLQFTQRSYNEYLSINNFWLAHQKHLSFYYKDIDFAETYRMVFDSGLRVQVNSPNSITISFVLREV